MLPKKRFAAKQSRVNGSVIFLFFLFFVQQSCKKDISNANITDSLNDRAAVTKFLTVPANLNPTVSRIINTIKQQEDKFHFLNKIIANEGFAL
jgi:hypothetical protein